MSTAWIRVEAFDSLPGVCAKTGEATEVRMAVVAEYVPTLFRPLQLLGVWSFLFAHAAGKRRRQVRLPVSRRAFRRYRAWQLGSVGAFVVGVVAGLAGSLAAHPLVELAGYGLAVAAVVVGVRQQQRTWVGITIDRKGREVAVTRCHPTFARAAGRLAGR